MKYKIEYAEFQSNATAPGIISSERTLSASKYPGIEMEYCTESHLLTAKLPKTDKLVLIHGANTKTMIGSIVVTPTVKK